ncbi:site-specific integrase [Sporomusa sphaeroides]|uniref:tyrosine-type recombinase/integrase n=1 Tax=Sporomusa sphaeroides TaxID=47679 RepID=UPI003DA130F0
MVFNEAFEIWLNVQAGRIRPISVKSYKSTIKNHIAPDIGTDDITSFTPDIAGKSFAEWRLIKSKPQMFEIKKTLSAMFSYFVDEGVLLRNPVKKMYVDKTPPDVIVPSQQEIKDFLLGTKDNTPYYPHFLLLATTGMRISELRGLQLSDVDLINHKVSIKRVFYKGAEHETKAKASRRKIDIPEFVTKVLSAHIEQIKNLAKDCKWLFPNRRGNPVSHQYLGKTLHYWQDQLKIPSFTPHAFRHAHATFLLEHGRSLKAIQQRLGWSSASMLLERYAHVTETERQILMENISNEFKATA